MLKISHGPYELQFSNILRSVCDLQKKLNKKLSQPTREWNLLRVFQRSQKKRLCARHRIFLQAL